MPTTLNDLTVDWKLMTNADSSGRLDGRLDERGMEEVVVFQVPFADRFTFLNQIKGNSTVYGSGSDAQTTRNTPLQSPWNENMYAVGVSWTGVGNATTSSTTVPWTHVLCTVRFATIPFLPEDPSQPYLVRRIRGAVQAITKPGVAYTYATSGDPIGEADVTVNVGSHIIEITRLELPDIEQFLSIAEPLEGFVNSDTVTIKKRTYEPGKLLFQTFSAEEQQNGLGAPKATATINLVWRQIKWNQVVLPDGTLDGISPNAYETAPLMPLFS